jgi:LuxR family quorum-sensing system transcriptional regulator CciR
MSKQPGNRRTHSPATGSLERRVARLRRHSGILDSFERAVELCNSDEELHSLLSDVTRELGFRHFALLHHASLTRRGSRSLFIHNYPEDWELEIVGKGLGTQDPVHLACQRINAGFSWTELNEIVRLTTEHRHILERASYHGIGAGFSVPANVPGEPLGSCSFACRRGQPLPRSSLIWSELIGARAFKRARCLRGAQKAASAAPHLSPREMQCLRLVAAGKSDWEIGAILGISEETVHQYVKRARAAYGVVTRAQLVVHGLRDGRISFEDDLAPPF